MCLKLIINVIEDVIIHHFFVSSQAFTHLGCSYKAVVPFQNTPISIGHQRNDVMMTAINVPITPIASLVPQSTATINYAIGRSGMYCAHLCRCVLHMQFMDQCVEHQCW